MELLSARGGLVAALAFALAGCLDASGKDTCVTDADCNAGRVCLSDQLCHSAVCPPIANGAIYVDSGAAPGGNGSTPGCALKTVDAAIAAIDSTDGFTVIVRGGETLDNPTVHHMPSNVTLTGGTTGSGSGHQSSFAACTSTDDCASTDWPTLSITTTTASGVRFAQPGPGALRWIQIVGPPATMNSSGVPTSTQDGVHVLMTGQAPIAIEHVRVRQFLHGIAVDELGNVAIGSDVVVEQNVNGLVARLGSTVSVVVAPGEAPTYFNSNTGFGVSVEAGATAFSMLGPPAPDPVSLAPGIGISFNGNHGLTYGATAPGAFIDGVNCRENGGNGFVLYAGSLVRVRDSHVYDNRESGIQIGANGGIYDVSGIDLGSASSGAGAGNNVIYGNASANLCVGGMVAANQPAGSLKARGNDFTDYHQASSPSKSCAASVVLTGGASCSGGVDVSDASTGAADVTSCTVQ